MIHIIIFTIIGICIGRLSKDNITTFFVGYEKGYSSKSYDVNKAYQEYLVGDLD